MNFQTNENVNVRSATNTGNLIAISEARAKQDGYLDDQGFFTLSDDDFISEISCNQGSAFVASLLSKCSHMETTSTEFVIQTTSTEFVIQTTSPDSLSESAV